MQCNKAFFPSDPTLTPITHKYNQMSRIENFLGLKSKFTNLKQQNAKSFHREYRDRVVNSQ